MRTEKFVVSSRAQSIKGIGTISGCNLNAEKQVTESAEDCLNAFSAEVDDKGEVTATGEQVLRTLVDNKLARIAKSAALGSVGGAAIVKQARAIRTALLAVNGNMSDAEIGAQVISIPSIREGLESAGMTFSSDVAEDSVDELESDDNE